MIATAVVLLIGLRNFRFNHDLLIQTARDIVVVVDVFIGTALPHHCCLNRNLTTTLLIVIT